MHTYLPHLPAACEWSTATDATPTYCTFPRLIALFVLLPGPRVFMTSCYDARITPIGYHSRSLSNQSIGIILDLYCTRTYTRCRKQWLNRCPCCNRVRGNAKCSSVSIVKDYKFFRHNKPFAVAAVLWLSGIPRREKSNPHFTVLSPGLILGDMRRCGNLVFRK